MNYMFTEMQMMALQENILKIPGSQAPGQICKAVLSQLDKLMQEQLEAQKKLEESQKLSDVKKPESNAEQIEAK